MKKISLLFFLGLSFFNILNCQNKKPTKNKLTDGIYALAETTSGNITIMLDYKNAPYTVSNFVGLAEGSIENTFRKKGEPYFDGLTFHRIEENFVIQGGDPLGNGTGGPGYEFENEISPNLKHDKKGVVAMANAGPNTNGSQFYITLGATSFLDGNYSVFGLVVEGLESIDKIVKNKAGKNIIKSIKIKRIGNEAKNFNAALVFKQKQEEFKLKNAEQSKAKIELEKKADELIAKAQTTKSGLKYIIQKQGNGKVPVKGDKIKVHYQLNLKDGSKIDSSYDRKEPFELEIGNSPVIQGWIEAIETFKRGTKLTLIVPPSLGYGANNSGPIPGNSTLFFEMEILE
ncbi:MAG: peptidylprolyl isomerase [Solirubrobacteraceae bacterium]